MQTTSGKSNDALRLTKRYFALATDRIDATHFLAWLWTHGYKIAPVEKRTKRSKTQQRKARGS